MNLKSRMLRVVMLGLAASASLDCGKTTRDAKSSDRDAGPTEPKAEVGGSIAVPAGSESQPTSGMATAEPADSDPAKAPLARDASTSEDGSSQDAEVADGAVSTRCFDPETVETCPPGYSPRDPAGVQEVLAATSIDKRARFTKMGYYAALAEIAEGEGSRWVGVYLAVDAPPRIVPLEWPDAVGDYRVLDIWGWMAWVHEDSASVRIAALACDQAECRILDGSVDDPAITPLAGYELPPDLDVDSVAGDEFENRICVYGDGLYCNYGSGWVAEIPPGTAGRLRAVRFWSYPYLAVGERGAFFVEVKKGNWQAVESGTSETLSGFDLEELEVFGDQGAWITASLSEQGEVSITSSCRQIPPLVVGSRVWSAFVVDQAANVYGWRYLGTGLELGQPVVCRLPERVTEKILDWGFPRCWDVGNVLAVTERAIVAPIGGPECAIID